MLILPPLPSETLLLPLPPLAEAEIDFEDRLAEIAAHHRMVGLR